MTKRTALRFGAAALMVAWAMSAYTAVMVDGTFETALWCVVSGVCLILAIQFDLLSDG